MICLTSFSGIVFFSRTSLEGFPDILGFAPILSITAACGSPCLKNILSKKADYWLRDVWRQIIIFRIPPANRRANNLSGDLDQPSIHHQPALGLAHMLVSPPGLTIMMIGIFTLVGDWNLPDISAIPFQRLYVGLRSVLYHNYIAHSATFALERTVKNFARACCGLCHLPTAFQDKDCFVALAIP